MFFRDFFGSVDKMQRHFAELRSSHKYFIRPEGYQNSAGCFAPSSLGLSGPSVLIKERSFVAEMFLQNSPEFAFPGVVNFQRSAFFHVSDPNSRRGETKRPARARAGACFYLRLDCGRISHGIFHGS